MNTRVVLLPILALLLAGCTGGGGGPDLDSDDDGIDDSFETEGKIITITLPNGTDRRTVTGDVGTVDTDGDGLSDGEEMNVRGTDPRDVDTDDDGLLDGGDRTPSSDEERDRWRAAGILDVNGTFLGELDGCPGDGPQLKPNVASSDLPLADQLLDGEELRGWDIEVRGDRRHVTSDPCVPDTDRDGLQDHDEKLAGSDPRDEDTDNDGTRDGSDADPLADLHLGLTDLTVSPDSDANATTLQIVVWLGEQAEEIRWPGNGSITLQVPDASASRTSLEVSFAIMAQRTDGDGVALTDDPRGAIVTIDLLAGTVSGVETDGDKLLFAGDDGSMTLRWSTVRR